MAAEQNFKKNEILFALLRRGLSCSACADADKDILLGAQSKEAWREAYDLALQHDVAAIASIAAMQLPQGGLDAVVSSSFEKQRMLSVFRYEKLEYVQKAVLEKFNASAIRHIPLKGAVIRGYYPEPYMRTSCDIDILVPPEELEGALNALESIGFRKENAERHDISLFSPDGVHLELHFALSDPDDPFYGEFFDGLWNDGVLPCGDSAPYTYRMKEELFYTYHMIHMAKHFKLGGCGIRPFADLWVLRNRGELLARVSADSLGQLGFGEFAKAAERLTQVWFDGLEHDDTTRMMEQFILDGGVYGSREQFVAVKRSDGGTLRYVLGRIFLSYDHLSERYNSLRGRKWLMPVYQVRRWFEAIFNGRLKMGGEELSMLKNAEGRQSGETSELLSRLGL